MMKPLILILALTTYGARESWAQKKITTFILVRHAEKADDGTKDPDLTDAGKERARRLADMLGHARVDAIYSTTFKRTTNTVSPLASNQKMTVDAYEAFKPEVIEDMIRKHAGGTIVISGHSNNIPWIANLLIGKEEYKNFDEADYGNLFVVSVVEKGKNASVTLLRY